MSAESKILVMATSKILMLDSKVMTVVSKILVTDLICYSVDGAGESVDLAPVVPTVGAN
jgi:hypothetical protein